MSLIASLPLAEIFSVGAGLAASALTLLVSKTKRRKSVVLAEYLEKHQAWQDFNRKRLKEILSDSKVDDNEWKEIIDALDSMVLEISKNNSRLERDVRYLGRTEKSKKMLVSDMLQHRTPANENIAA